MFSITLQSMVSDLNVNTVTAYTAVQQAVEGWKLLPRETKKSFIYTGNVLNTMIMPTSAFTTLGTGKAASAYWIGTADAVHSAEGLR